MHRFKLTKPLSSNKIYLTTSLKHGANKCLNELNRKNNCCDEFTMVNVDTLVSYKFVINKNIARANKNTVNNDNVIIDELRGRVKYLESHISTLCNNDLDKIISPDIKNNE